MDKIQARDALKLNIDGVRTAVRESLQSAVNGGGITPEEQSRMVEAVAKFMQTVSEAQIEGAEQFEDSEKGLPITFLMATMTLMEVMLSQVNGFITSAMVASILGDGLDRQVADGDAKIH